MLIIQEVSTEEQLQEYQEQQDILNNTYLYILAYSNSLLYINKDEEHNLVENTISETEMNQIILEDTEALIQ